MAARSSLCAFQPVFSTLISQGLPRSHQIYRTTVLNALTRSFSSHLPSEGTPFLHTTRTFFMTLPFLSIHRCSNIYPLGLHRVNPRIQRVMYSNGTSGNKSQSYTERIKVVLKEYGGVGVAFHTVMSLFSLGTCYILVDNGLDVSKILNYFNVESSVSKKGASTFAIAYVFHKFLLPIRATITVVSVPVIVRNLRLRGWMKGPVPKVKDAALKVKN